MKDGNATDIYGNNQSETISLRGEKRYGVIFIPGANSGAMGKDSVYCYDVDCLQPRNKQLGVKTACTEKTPAVPEFFLSHRRSRWNREDGCFETLRGIDKFFCRIRQGS